MKAFTVLLALLCALGPSAALADARRDARKHFRRGMDLISRGDFDSGVAELQRAYDIKPHKNVLYNIARAYLDAGRVPEAVAFYRRYLATDPDDRDVVAATVSKLEAGLAQPPPPEPPPAQVGDASSATERHMVELLERLERAVVKAENVRPAPAPRPPPAQPAPSIADADREAEAGAADVPAYEEVVVTASKRAQTTLEAPVATTIITEEEIALSGAQTIPELLRRVPGADVMMMGVASANTSIRGFNQRLSNKLLVLVDGRSVYQDYLGFTLWPLVPISLTDIERIEVIRGPGSTLYGANAFVGVVNIITKPAGSGPRAALTLTGGAGNTGAVTFSASSRQDRFRYRASAAFHQTDKWSVDFAPDRADITPRQPDPTLGAQTLKANLVGEVDLGQRRTLALSGGATRLDTEIYPIGLLRNFYFTGDEGYLKADLTVGPMKLRGFWNHLQAVSGPQYWPAGVREIETHVESDIVDTELQLDHEFQLLGEHHVVAGLGYRMKQVDWDYLPSLALEHHFSGFAQEEWKPIESLRLVGSYRIDRHPLLDAGKPGLAHSPRGAVIWLAAPGHAVRGTVSTAFRVPTILESYVDVRLPLPGVDGGQVRSTGSRELKPEQIFHTELGYVAELEPLTLDVAAYRSEVRDLVLLSTLSTASAQDAYDPQTNAFLLGRYHFLNDEPSYTALGAEVGVKATPFERSDVRANAAYERVTTSEPDESRCAPCAQVPRLKMFLGASYRTLAGVDFAGDVAWVGETRWLEREPSRVAPTQEAIASNPLESYLVANVRVGYRFLGDKMELAIVGTNLAAPHKEHPFGNRIQRRMFLTLGGAL